MTYRTLHFLNQSKASLANFLNQLKTGLAKFENWDRKVIDHSCLGSMKLVIKFPFDLSAN